MNHTPKPSIFLGIDSGATTCKINGVDASGKPLDHTLRQYPTQSADGIKAVLEGWIHATDTFLKETNHTWMDVAGIGLGMPGPFLERGVLGNLPNYPDVFNGWHFAESLSTTVMKHTGQAIPVTSANDGHLAGLAEAALIQSEIPGSVFLLAPGSGLGSAYVDASGKILEGDHLCAAFFCCMPMPYEALGLPKLTCGCGRNWGCIESYTALSGLGDLIEHVLPRHHEHAFHKSKSSKREKALALRGLARKEDALALEVFDLQAKAMGYAIAMASMAYDPTHIVIAGGLMDTEATTPAFRERYMTTLQDSAAPLLWVKADQLHYHEARLGELSQAIGAALLVRSSLAAGR